MILKCYLTEISIFIMISKINFLLKKYDLTNKFSQCFVMRTLTNNILMMRETCIFMNSNQINKK